MRPARSAGPWRRRGEARRGITRLAGRTAPEGRGYRAEVADLAPQRRGALQGPPSSRPVRRQGRGASATTGGGPLARCRAGAWCGINCQTLRPAPCPGGSTGPPARRCVSLLTGTPRRAVPPMDYRDKPLCPEPVTRVVPGRSANREAPAGPAFRTDAPGIMPGTAKPGLASPALRRVRTAAPLR
jgi:hypothetical protein